MLTLFVALGAK